jgi:hypothetical protein
MQHLYMMAALIRENQMKRMAKEINAGLISIEQAMTTYGVFSKEAVIRRVEMLNQEIERHAEKNQWEVLDLKAVAA